MGEPLGMLKVVVVQGKRLAIRDFKTSDPYVIVKLGNQVIWVPFPLVGFVNVLLPISIKMQ
ncbi:hypothetical protein SLEP1_g29147 [Rubroshorea leprosula]|uniref:Uncharacterized protein n=1 Tax=Rubroshorea leprosula TaxID=152421 RepID=A0AAV5JVZ2_9ROSI|nr:hypothetical protein SLEP1_g29147 [Rubroshorea leprosula]